MRFAFNASSAVILSRLPEELQTAIERMQLRIESAVLQHNPGSVASSGFRDTAYNRSIGGKQYSKHLWGMARDYLRNSRSHWNPVPGLRMIDEGVESNCVHFELE